MAEMKGIKLCGECGNYDYKKHRCRIGCIDDSNAQASFYGDCPLPDVVPKSEVEAMQRLYGEKLEVAEALIATLNKTKSEVAREIFEEIEEAIEKCKYNQSTPFGIEERYNPYAIIKQVAKLKKKYTEEK